MRDPVDIERELAERATGMDFFQILRLLENAHRDKPRIGAAASRPPTPNSVRAWR
jgi:type VI secretion system protein ImpH